MMNRELPPSFDVSELNQRLLNSRILLLCHQNPDGDALGALLGLGNALLAVNLDVTMVCKDGAPEPFDFLPGANRVLTSPEGIEYETVIFLDCGADYMTGLHEEYPRLLSDDVHRVVIDHHKKNAEWGHQNLVLTEAASTTQILAMLLPALGLTISPAVATCLLTGLYTDTGAFGHQNTSAEVFSCASDLMAKGADLSAISSHIFQTQPFKNLKLWGHVLRSADLSDDGAVIVGVHENDYRRFGCERSDLTGVIDYLSAVPEADYSVMLTEDGSGNVKASLRTRKDDVDVQALAQIYGGGGHVKASGFTQKKARLKREVKWKIVAEDD